MSRFEPILKSDVALSRGWLGYRAPIQACTLNKQKRSSLASTIPVHPSSHRTLRLTRRRASLARGEVNAQRAPVVGECLSSGERAPDARAANVRRRSHAEMFFHVNLERNITLEPRHFGARMRAVLEEKLRHEVREQATQGCETRDGRRVGSNFFTTLRCADRRDRARARTDEGRCAIERRLRERALVGMVSLSWSRAWIM